MIRRSFDVEKGPECLRVSGVVAGNVNEGNSSTAVAAQL